MLKIRPLPAKILYGILFACLLPLLLALWAKGTSDVIDLPVPGNPLPGYIFAFAGILIIITGVLQLWIQGKGLPMNPFPPEKLVKSGLYSIIKHPIYTGAVIALAGFSIIFRSDSGLWFVTPLFTLMVVAYVFGFEKDRTGELFDTSGYRTFLTFPESSEENPSGKERFASYFLAFTPWLLVYESFILAGVPSRPWLSNLPFEHRIPVIEWSVIVYSSVYLYALLVPILSESRSELRRFIIDIWFVSIVTFIIYFAFPFIVSQRQFIPVTAPGRFILSGRALDNVTGALPSFHVIWAFVSARYFTRKFRKLAVIWYTIALMIALSCVTTGNHSIPDIAAGFTVYLLAVYRNKLWNYIRRLAELTANSWKEWKLGPARLISHGLYGGLAGFTGTIVACSFITPAEGYVILLIIIAMIAGAGLWAQLVEGSPKLLRPYGYYGGLLGAIAGSALISVFTPVKFGVLAGSLAMAAPWIQAAGRLRCLVQGCCHGRPCSPETGIKFTHPLSRVNKISHLVNVPLHPTQLYSIAANLITGLMLFRLFQSGFNAFFIAGFYLIMNGIARFVEEAYRGEAQTPYFAGMRVYQWLAILSILSGAILTTINCNTVLVYRFSATSAVYSVAAGILVTIASGVDFPGSDRRFARLTTN